MNTINKISVTSERNIGLQVLKDYLTSTEKKILTKMLNTGQNEGQVKNKIFCINKTENNTANIIICTITYSDILGKNEIIKHKVKIKYS